MGTGTGRTFRLAVIGLAGAAASPALAADDAGKPVTVVTVGTATEPKRFTGVIAAEQTIPLSFAVGGLVKTVNAAPDTIVSKGDVLAALDGAHVNETVSAARAALTRAQNALAAAKSNLSRMQILVDQGLDEQAVVDAAQAKVDDAEKALEGAKAALNAAEADVAKIELVAPADAIIVLKSVVPFQEVAAGKDAFTVQALGDLRAAFTITETAAGNLTIGMPVDIDIVDPAGGTIGRLDWLGQAEAGSGHWQGKATLTNPPQSVRSGQSVIVTIDAPAHHGDGFAVPASAVVAESGAAYVFVVSGDTAKRMPVVADTPSNNTVTVTEGLAAGDRVVVDPAGLADGDTVTVTSG